MKALLGRVGEDGAATYVHMLVVLVGIYVITALHANGRLPKDLKHFGVEPRELAKRAFQDAQQQQVKDDKVRAVFGIPSTKHSQAGIEKEYIRPLGDDFVQPYQDLCALLQGDFGLSLLSSFDLVSLGNLTLSLMNELLSSTSVP